MPGSGIVLFDLTPLTVEAKKQQRTIIKGFDVPTPLLRASIVGALVALPVTGVAWTILHEYALVVFAAVFGAVLWLLLGVSTSGMQQRNVDALRLRRRDRSTQFLVGSRPVNPGYGQWGYFLRATRRVRDVAGEAPALPYGKRQRAALPAMWTDEADTGEEQWSRPLEPARPASRRQRTHIAPPFPVDTLW